MARTAQIIGQTTDVFGQLWEVRERRPAPHGWLVEIGWPLGRARQRGRGVAIILTQPLAEYLTTTRLRAIRLCIGETAARPTEVALRLGRRVERAATRFAHPDPGAILPPSRPLARRGQPAPRTRRARRASARPPAGCNARKPTASAACRH